MATVNRSKTAPLYTHEGARARHIPATAQLERSVMSCLLWENEFYESGVSIAERIAELVKVVPVAEVARITVAAKRDMRLRHIPLFLTRELLRKKEAREWAQQLFPLIITRPDDLTEFLALYWKDNAAEPLAKQVKKHLGTALSTFTEYQLGKYNGGKKAITLRDALRILRPKPKDGDTAELFRKVVKGELATPDTWEVELSRGGDKKASWTRLLAEKKLGGLAMLRNIRNMREAGVDRKLISQGIEGIHAGKLLPINFIAAARHNVDFEPAFEAKFFECFGKEKAEGDTIILVDVSSSMDAPLSGRSELQRIDVACSLAMIGRELFSSLRVFTFSNSLVEVAARRGFALRDSILTSQPHGGTNLGAAARALPAGDYRLIVITDEQSSDPVPDRAGYMLNVASAKNGIGYGEWTHIDGWSDKVLDYILRCEHASVAQEQLQDIED